MLSIMMDHTKVAGADIVADEERERIADSRPTVGLVRPVLGGQGCVAIPTTVRAYRTTIKQVIRSEIKEM